MSFSPNISHNIQDQSIRAFKKLENITSNDKRLEQLSIDFLSCIISPEKVDINIKAVNSKLAAHGVDMYFLNKIQNVRNFAFKLGEICKIPYYNGMKQKNLTYKFFQIFWEVIEPHIKEAYDKAKEQVTSK